MLINVTSEDILMTKMISHYDEYFWNRCIVTGVSRTGKSTFLDKFHKVRGLKPIHSPNFEMCDKDTYLFLKYSFLIDRWFNWDRYVFVDKEPIYESYTHDILPVIFVGNQFDGYDTRDSKTQNDKYIELAELLSEKYNNVILFNRR